MTINRRDFIAGAGAILSSGALASPVRSLISPRDEALKSLPTVSDYVQDGLVAMWDGVFNDLDESGTPFHNEYAGSPRDLVSGDVLDVYGGDIEIGDEYFRVVPGVYASSPQPLFASAIQNKDFELEAVVTNDTTANAGIFSIGAKNKRGLWLYSGSGYTIETLNVLAENWSQGINPNFLSPDPYSISVYANLQTGKYNMELNDRFSWSLYGSLSSGITPTDFRFGLIDGFTTSGDASYYNVRLYSRSLSAKERGHNRKVDNLRFGV